MKRSGRRRKRNQAPSVPMDRAIERSSQESFGENAIVGGLAALAVPLANAYLTQKTTLTASMTPANTRLLVGGGSFVAGLLVHKRYPMLGVGLSVAGVLFGLQPYAEQALSQLAGTTPST